MKKTEKDLQAEFTKKFEGLQRVYRENAEKDLQAIGGYCPSGCTDAAVGMKCAAAGLCICDHGREIGVGGVIVPSRPVENNPLPPSTLAHDYMDFPR